MTSTIGNVQTHTLLDKIRKASHTGKVFAFGAKQQNININIEVYGNVWTKRHDLEHKDVCCRGKVAEHGHHQS